MATINIENSKSAQAGRHLKLMGHIGFDSLPEQLVSKSIKNGFIFNIICIGETGIGKSTLMDSLFNACFESHPSSHVLKGVNLKDNAYELKEGNVQLKLTIVDTVGYGDQIDKKDCFKDIVDYIDAQFDNYMQEELKIKRAPFSHRDTRVHVCLYFICPTGHGLKAIDLVCMKQLDKKVNIVPIIAKADSISKLELKNFKSNVKKELESYGIEIYKFPTDDESIADVNNQMNAQMPFAVVGSRDFIRVGNKMMRIREYPWGIVEVENEAHSDFIKLREMLIRTNMEDMRDKTHNHFYEIYRGKRLRELGLDDGDNESFSYRKICESKRIAFQKEFENKEEEMRKSFVTRVKNAEAELKQAEKDLYSKFDSLEKFCIDEKIKLDKNFRKLEEEIKEFNKMKIQATSQYTSHYNLTLGRNKKKPL